MADLEDKKDKTEHSEMNNDACAADNVSTPDNGNEGKTEKIDWEANDTTNPSDASPEEDKTAGTENEKLGRRDIKKLKNELTETQKALENEKKRSADLNDKFMRTAAEYDNFRKRSAKERETVYGDAVSDTLTGLLPIIDNLQYAAKYTEGDADKFIEGVNLILSKLPDTLERLGIKPFGEAGDKFDPSVHNAVMHVEDDSLEEGVITDVLQCGYMYGEKVIRYAMVKVAN